MLRRALLICLCSVSLISQADTLRCGSKLVSIGDRKFEVWEKCGEPRYLDEAGYTISGYERRELSIQEWVYGPDNGMFSILTFEGNRLVRIERRRQR